jgi:S-formylglutathione hydrolase FrmB
MSRMRRTALTRLLLAAALALAACGGGGGGDGDGARATPAATKAAQALRVQSQDRLSARLTDFYLATPALDQPAHVQVLLPRGYDPEGTRRYPVLYLLHGCCGAYDAWTQLGEAEAITRRYPLIVVMPEGGSNGWYTDWYAPDGATTRPLWETFHVEQLIPWVDARFKTVAQRGGRAVAGLSMGGYGALVYAARHPGLFVAAASYSGAVEEASEEALGPRSENPERWREHLPIDQAAHLKDLELLELRTGDGRPGPYERSRDLADCGGCQLEGYLYPSNVRLHERLDRLGIRHVWVHGRGSHDWPYWRRDLRRTLPALMRVLD